METLFSSTWDGTSPHPATNTLGLSGKHLHRILRYISVADNGCWEWTHGQDGAGYGRIYIGTLSHSQVLAHRLVYELSHGVVGEQFDVHHRMGCAKTCVNPAHMQILKHGEHAKISNLGVKRTLKSHCVNGHEYTPENTGWYKKGVHVGKRYCRTCVNGRCNARYHATHQPPEPITHCKNGHEFTDENIYWLRAASGNLTRACRTCRTNRTNEYRERNRDHVLIRRRELRTAKKVA